jgi:hypothetical protein
MEFLGNSVPQHCQLVCIANASAAKVRKKVFQTSQHYKSVRGCGGDDFPMINIRINLSC